MDILREENTVYVVNVEMVVEAIKDTTLPVTTPTKQTSKTVSAKKLTKKNEKSA